MTALNDTLTYTTTATCPESELANLIAGFGSAIGGMRADDRLCPPGMDINNMSELYPTQRALLFSAFGQLQEDNLTGDDGGDKSFAFETSVVVSLGALAIRLL